MAIDIIARGLATSLIGPNGKISSDKMPTFGATPEGTTFYPIGALTDPSLLEGKTADEILLMILFGTVNPTFTNPSFKASLNTSTTIYAGRKQILTGTLTFNRGKISPANGTSGLRAGAPYSYSVGDQTIESTSLSQAFTIELTPVQGENSIACKVFYNEGEQPLNSAGEIYGTPYPAGSLSYNLTFTAVYPPYSNEGNEIPFITFKESDGEGYQVTMASEGSSGNRQSFAIASVMTVIGIKQFDIISQDWQWIGGDAESSLETFDTTIISGDSLDESIDYVLYTYNGVQAGERQLRIYVKEN